MVYVHASLFNYSLFFVVEFGVVSEYAEGAELLTPAAFHILCDLRFVLNTVVELEDEIVFPCSL